MKKHLFSLALLAVVSMSCHQSTSPSAVVGPHGDMTGRVLPLDVNGDTLWSMLAGTTVSLESTSFITTTDSAGHWTLKDVPAAIYSIYFAKNGFDTVGFDDLQFNKAGDGGIPDWSIVRIPTDSMFLDYAKIRDGRFYGQGHREIFYGGHITSNKSQAYEMHITLDSVSNNEWYAPQGMVMSGQYTGDFESALDPYTVGVIALDSLSSGRKIFVRAELLPVNEYVGCIGTLTHDYSNTIEVTVP